MSAAACAKGVEADGAHSPEGGRAPRPSSGGIVNDAPKLEMVSVHGEIVECAREESTVWVAVGRVCRVLGLDFSGQHQRLSNPDRSPWARLGVMPMVGADGRTRDVFAVALDTLPMWLVTVDASRVAAAVRPKLLLFQVEAAAVLRNHFFGVRGGTVGRSISRTEALRLALEASEERDRLEAEVLTLAPKAELADRLTNADGLQTIEEVAKTLGTGRNRLFGWLRSSGFLLSSGFPRQTHVDAGRAIVRERTYEREGRTKLYTRVYLSAKGVAFVAAAFASSSADAPVGAA